MKYLSKLLTLIVVLSLTIFMSCKKGGGGGGDDPTPPVGQETAEALAAGTWSVSTGDVRLDGVAREEWAEAGFTLTFEANSSFTGGTYRATNVPNITDADLVWTEGSGSWAFNTDSNGDPIIDEVIRDGDDSIILSINPSVDGGSGTLTISFTVPEPTNRIDGFTGPWVFDFSL